MSSGPQPPELPQTKREYEGPGEIFAPIKQFKDIQKFLKTRKAILDEEPLYKTPKDELTGRGLMGPWKFNFTQSTICALPGIALATFAWLIDPGKAAPISNMDPITQKILSVLNPLAPPFTLLLIVYTIALCSLPPGYTTAENWKAAQRKYLYMDAALGFWPQLALAFSIALFGMGRLRPSFIVIGLLGLLLYVGAFVWQAFVTGYKIRESMFDFDYLTEEQTMFSSLRERPYFKFYVLAGIGLPILASFVQTILEGIAAIGTVIVHSIAG